MAIISEIGDAPYQQNPPPQTIAVGDTFLTTLTPGDGDTFNISGAQAATVHTITIDGIDTSESFQIRVHGGGYEINFNEEFLGMSSGQTNYELSHTDTSITFTYTPYGNGIDVAIDILRVSTPLTGDLAVAITMVEGDHVGPSAGNDRLYAYDGDDIDLLGGNDTVWGSSGNETLRGGDGDDYISGAAGADLILGGNGNDRLYVGHGFSTVEGGDGDDFIYASGFNTGYLDGGAGNDTINSFRGFSTINGGTGDDELSAVAETKTFVFEADSGNDTINGNFGSGTHVIDLTALGITSFDQLDIADVAGSSVITLSPGNTITLSNTAPEALNETRFIFADAPLPPADDTVGYSVLGTAAADAMTGDNSEDSVHGGAGDDTLLGGQGDDSLHGGDGNDSVNGGDGSDDLKGGAGNDTLDGGKDDDTLDGGDGNDLLQGGFGNDLMTGGAGADVFQIIPNNGVDTITDFTPGEDSIDVTAIGLSDVSQMTVSQSGADTVIDFGGGNSLTLTGVDAATIDNSWFALADAPASQGTSGDDKIVGTLSGDIILGGDDKDRLMGGDGDDSLYGEKGNDKLYGGAGADLLDGGNNNDQLYGGDGGDVLNGDQGNDKLIGEVGADTLDGGRGRDVLTGGLDADVFVFTANSGVDTIMDFEDGVDQIDLTALNLSGVGDLAMTQIGGNVQISLDGTFANTVMLIGTDIADIDASDFLF